MITHVVLLQPKTEFTREELAAALSRAQALQQIIPGSPSFRVKLKNSLSHL